MSTHLVVVGDGGAVFEAGQDGPYGEKPQVELHVAYDDDGDDGDGGDDDDESKETNWS